MIATNSNTKTNQFLENLPPCSIDSEEAILGGILLDPNALGRVSKTLPAEAFYLEAHSIIYKAFSNLDSQGKVCDLLTVAGYLTDKGKLDKVGGRIKLAQLCDRVVSAVNIDQYAEILIEKWHQRQLIEFGQETIRLGHSSPNSVDHVAKIIAERASDLANSPYLKKEADPQLTQYQKMLERIKGIELNSDPGFREWLMQNLAKEYGRSARQLEDVYFKSLAATEIEPSMSFEELKEKYGDDCTEWFIHGLIPKGAVILLHALGYTGKTRLFYDLLFSIVTGQPWADFNPTAPQRRVLIIQADETPSDMLRAIQQRGLDDPSYPVRYKTKWLADHMDDLRREIEQWQPDLVMIDSLTAINRRSTFEENQTEYARPVFMLRDLAQEFGISVLLTHHSNSEGKARGTKAVFNAVSEVWALSRLENDKRLDSPVRQLKLEKTRSRSPETYKIQYDPDTSKWAFEGVMNFEGFAEDLMNEAERKIYNFLNERKGTAFERAELCEFLNYSEGHLRKTIKPLLHRGLITQRKSKFTRRYVYLIDWEGDQGDQKVIIENDHPDPPTMRVTAEGDQGDHPKNDHPDPPTMRVTAEGDQGDHQNGFESDQGDHLKRDEKNDHLLKTDPYPPENGGKGDHPEMITFDHPKPEPQKNGDKGDHPEMITHDHPKEDREEKTTAGNKQEKAKPKFKIGDRIDTDFGKAKIIKHFSGLKEDQYEIQLEETGDYTIVLPDMMSKIKGKASKPKPWGTENDLPPEQIDQLVIDYLKEHGESEEYQIICRCQQKSPEVRAALQRVAIRTGGDRWETFWKLEDGNGTR